MKIVHELKTLILAVCMFGLSVCPTVAFGQQEPFTIAAIPDTQGQSLTDVFTESVVDQAGWIRDNAGSENIKLATHLGDVAQGPIIDEGLLKNFFLDGIPQWQWESQLKRTSEALGQFDLANDEGTLPYSISNGNHDFIPTGDKTNVDDPISPTGWTTYFGPDRYNDYDTTWYGGSDPTGLSHYQFFEANGHTYMHLNLEYKPDEPELDSDLSRGGFDNALEWAQTVLDENPNKPTIISTHQYLSDLDPDEVTPEAPDPKDTGYQGDGFDEFFGGKRIGTGDRVFDQLIRSNSQIFMTLNGHDHEGPYREDGEFAQISINDEGLPVYEILADYQDYNNPLTGNDAYIRLIEFDPEAGQIRNMTFSPTWELFMTETSALEDRLDAVLDGFADGEPVVLNNGEDAEEVLFTASQSDFVNEINGFFGSGFAKVATRAEAEEAILEFFDLTDRAQLGDIDLSPYLTDRDSQFNFNVRFDETGRPIPEPGTLTLLGLALAAATRRPSRR